jgi:hypothetical protein
MAVLPAGCEEVAFRGFLLTGLARRFRAPAAVVICGFLYAIYPMNVFQFLPHLVFGIVMSFLVLRANSIVPAVLAHAAFRSLLFFPLLVPGIERLVPDVGALELSAGERSLSDLVKLALGAGGVLAVAVGLAAFWALSRSARRSSAFPTIYFPNAERPAESAPDPAALSR